jgi:hypothetical protein
MGIAMPDEAGAYKQQGIDYGWEVKKRKAYWKTQRLLILLALLVFPFIVFRLIFGYNGLPSLRAVVQFVRWVVGGSPLNPLKGT